jgi:hypothetical protein
LRLAQKSGLFRKRVSEFSESGLISDRLGDRTLYIPHRSAEKAGAL